jgi:hypothetical protein
MGDVGAVVVVPNLDANVTEWEGWFQTCCTKYDPPATVNLLVNMPRGSDNAASILEAYTTQDWNQYVMSVVVVPGIILGMLLLWIILLLVCCCLGPKRVGFFSGANMTRPEEVAASAADDLDQQKNNDNGNTSPNTTPVAVYKRPRRVRITFIICALLLLVFTGTFSFLGVANLRKTTSSLVDAAQTAMGVAADAKMGLNAVTTRTEQARETVFGIMIGLGSVCRSNRVVRQAAEQLGTLISATGTVNGAADGPDANLNFMDSLMEVQDTLLGMSTQVDVLQIQLRDATLAIQVVDESLSYQTYSCISVVILVLLLVISVLLVWCTESRNKYAAKVGGCWSCVTQWLFMPLFILVMMLFWISGCAIFVSAIMNADVCIAVANTNAMNVNVNVNVNVNNVAAADNNNAMALGEDMMEGEGQEEISKLVKYYAGCDVVFPYRNESVGFLKLLYQNIVPSADIFFDTIIASQLPQQLPPLLDDEGENVNGDGDGNGTEARERARTLQEPESIPPLIDNGNSINTTDININGNGNITDMSSNSTNLNLNLTSSTIRNETDAIAGIVDMVTAATNNQNTNNLTDGTDILDYYNLPEVEPSKEEEEEEENGTNNSNSTMMTNNNSTTNSSATDDSEGEGEGEPQLEPEPQCSAKDLQVVDDVKAWLSQLEQSPAALQQLANGVSCHRVSPVYAKSVNEALCTYNVTALTWLMMSLLSMSICGFVMITLRSALKPVLDHNHDEEGGGRGGGGGSGGEQLGLEEYNEHEDMDPNQQLQTNQPQHIHGAVLYDNGHGNGGGYEDDVAYQKAMGGQAMAPGHVSLSNGHGHGHGPMSQSHSYEDEHDEQREIENGVYTKLQTGDDLGDEQQQQPRR